MKGHHAGSDPFQGHPRLIGTVPGLGPDRGGNKTQQRRRSIEQSKLHRQTGHAAAALSGKISGKGRFIKGPDVIITLAVAEKHRRNF
jgi:hypothetical protein